MLNNCLNICFPWWLFLTRAPIFCWLRESLHFHFWEKIKEDSNYFNWYTGSYIPRLLPDSEFIDLRKFRIQVFNIFFSFSRVNLIFSSTELSTWLIFSVLCFGAIWDIYRFMKKPSLSWKTIGLLMTSACFVKVLPSVKR